MQRAVLNVCRENELSDSCRILMMPGWYRAAWVATGAKRGSITLMFLEGGWLLGLGTALLPVVVTSFVPVPFGHFPPILTRHLETQARDGFEEA